MQPLPVITAPQATTARILADYERAFAILTHPKNSTPPMTRKIKISPPAAHMLTTKHYYLGLKKPGIRNAILVNFECDAVSAADAVGMALAENPGLVVISCQSRGLLVKNSGKYGIIDYEIPRHLPFLPKEKKSTPPLPPMFEGAEGWK